MIFYYLDKLLLSIYPHINNYNKNLYIFLIGIVLYISLFYFIDSTTLLYKFLRIIMMIDIITIAFIFEGQYIKNKKGEEPMMIYILYTILGTIGLTTIQTTEPIDEFKQS